MELKKICLIIILSLVGLSMINGRTFLFIGDSITDGNWGSPDKYPCSSEERNLWDKNHILGHGYTEMTAGYYMGEYPDSGYNFINRGISGETLLQIASRWNKDALAYKPDVISLLCGTNNVHYWLEGNPSGIKDFDFEAYMSELDSLVKLTRRELPGVDIVLCTPFVGKAGYIAERPDFDLRKETVDSLAVLTKNYVENHPEQNLKLVDFNRLAECLLRENNNVEYWLWDGIHPTTAMHHRMMKEWVKVYGK